MKKLFSNLTIFYLLLSVFIAAAAGQLLRQKKTMSLEGREEEKLNPGAFEYEYLQRTFPYYQYDPAAIPEAIKAAKQMQQRFNDKLMKSGRDIPSWEFLGPVNIGGRVVDIEFDPQNSSIVYAAAATGGVLKSYDAGTSWSTVFDEQSVLTVGDLAIDPKNTKTIYCGTGEANGGHNNFPGGGIYKSTDGGASWQLKGLTNTASIGRVLVDPVNTQNVYVAAVGSYFSPNPERGIFKSTDGGETWQKSLFISDSTGAIDIVMHPDNPQYLIASVWERVRRPSSSHLFGGSSGLYRSLNGGQSWQKISSQVLPDAKFQNVGRIGLAVTPASPGLVYALYSDGYEYLGLYRSDDFGLTWQDADADKEISAGTSNFSWYFGQVRIHPKNPKCIYVLDVSFIRSLDGGSSWDIIYGYSGPAELHVDHHALAFRPDNPDYLLSGNDGGINISENAGLSWSQPRDIPVTQFYEIGLDMTNPNRLYGGTQDNNTIRTMTGQLNDWEAIIGGDGFYVIVDPYNPDISYAESQNGYLLRTLDGWNTMMDATSGINFDEPRNWSTPVVMDPNNNRTLYYGTNRVYRSTNAAEYWSPVSPRLSGTYTSRSFGTVSTIAVAPGNSSVVYAGTDDGRVWVTKDSCTSWTDITSGLPKRWVTRVAVDPKDENTVYATFSGLKWKDPQPHIYKSTDMGRTWQNISSNLPDAPIDAIAIDLKNSSTIYIGTDVGAFVSFNGGGSWEIIASGLPVVPVNDMKIHPATNELIIGTYGRSMYKVDLDHISLQGDENHQRPVSFSLAQNYPNPFNPETRIEFTLPSSGNVSLTIYDSNGEKVRELINGYRPQGRHSVDFNAQGLSSGVYIYSLRFGSSVTARKMAVVR